MADIDAKQMRALLQAISTDPQLQQSKDSILLAEDQYPDRGVRRYLYKVIKTHNTTEYD